MQRHSPDDLIQFPCSYEFKVFGDADDEGLFRRSVQAAIDNIVPVCDDAVRVRLSSGGKYQCVSVLVYLENSRQLTTIYTVLRSLDGIRYLL